MLDHIPGYIKLSAVAVIKPEPVKKGCHLLDVGLHILPGIGRVARFLSISYPDEISPHVDSPPEIIVLFGECKVLPTVSPSSNPAIIEGVEALALRVFLPEDL